MNRVWSPGTPDGGDVPEVGDTVHVGLGGRTDGAGVQQLRAPFEPLGAQVVAVPAGRVLRPESAVAALPDATVVGHEPPVDAPSLFPRCPAVPEEPGPRVVLLGGGRLLMAAGAPGTAGPFAGLGPEPVVVDIGESAKLEACVTCLSVRLASCTSGHPAGRPYGSGTCASAERADSRACLAEARRHVCR